VPFPNEAEALRDEGSGPVGISPARKTKLTKQKGGSNYNIPWAAL